jgi:hypothetical protein
MSTFRLSRNHADTVYLQLGAEPSGDDPRVAIFLRGDGDAAIDAAWVVSALNGTPPQVPAKVLALLRDLTDGDPCLFDHHGGCQAHGYLTLQPGELCPHEEAKRLLADHRTEGA